MTRHLTETELALMAGGDCSPVSRFFLDRHLRRCPACLDRMTEFAILREDIAGVPMDDLNWDQLAAEMSASGGRRGKVFGIRRSRWRSRVWLSCWERAF